MHPIVYQDPASIVLYAGCLQAQTVRVGLPADSDQQFVYGDVVIACPTHARDANRAVFKGRQFLVFVFGHNFNTILAQLLGDDCRRVGIFPF